MHDLMTATALDFVRKRDPEYYWRLSFVFGIVTIPFMALAGLLEGQYTKEEVSLFG
jgi:hypothetical protein